MGKMGLLDLEHHFAFYGAYHSNWVNILIHMVFVWPIFFTALLLSYFLSFHLSSNSKLGVGFWFFSPAADAFSLNLNLGFFVASIYALFYFCLDRKAGSLAAFICFACWVGASSLASRLGFSLSWKVVLGAQLICWTGQFIGHGVFEKRAPALLDNLIQAFVMAPFFVLLEALHTFFGYEPYPGFRASVDVKIADEIKEWKDKKAKKLS